MNLINKMKEKVILITGAKDGIGRQTATELAFKGHKIIVHGRTSEKSESVKDYITNLTGNLNIIPIHADFSKLDEVYLMANEFLNRFDKLDVLINNAGIYMKEKVLTENGYESTFAINHLAHFLLTLVLGQVLKNSEDPRIINVSSLAHKRVRFDKYNLNAENYFDSYNAYALSKLCNILFTRALIKMVDFEHMRVNSLHPGVIDTKLLRIGFSIKGAELKQGSRTSVFLDASDFPKSFNGMYFIDEKPAEYSSEADDENNINDLWSKSIKFINNSLNIDLDH